MVGIQGLGGVPEPKSGRPAKVRDEREIGSRDNGESGGKVLEAKDGVLISSEARAAAELSRIVQMTKSQETVRAEKVAAAKERLERGDYKNPEVVAKVAERLMKYLG